MLIFDAMYNFVCTMCQFSEAQIHFDFRFMSNIVYSHATALILIHYQSSRNIFRTFRDELLEQADKDNLRIMLVRLFNPHPVKTV
jgi:hypothetical protein